MPSSTEQSLCRPLVFSQSAKNPQFIKVCLRYINPRGISGTCNMKLRLAIEFPTPHEW